ncbi:MAG TPA: hypothetical protein VNO25_18600, partial [Streptosporangiaceae bacterium]|nr:hypothetical protein [Streptosporangiaceae bacterium]
AMMITVQRTANVRGKTPVWPAVILHTRPANQRQRPLQFPGRRRTGQFARINANAHGECAAAPVGRHFTGKAFVAFARFGAGPAGNVPGTDECGTLTD